LSALSMRVLIESGTFEVSIGSCIASQSNTWEQYVKVEVDRP
jgi:hypothetical protein